MLKIYIIGSNKFNALKSDIYENLNRLEGVFVSAVGFSSVFELPLKKGDFENLHDLEDKSIQEADVVILVDKKEIGAISYMGIDTLRELEYAKGLGKTIWTSDMLFINYLKIKGQQ